MLKQQPHQEMKDIRFTPLNSMVVLDLQFDTRMDEVEASTCAHANSVE
jgi:hypothetical protein